MRIAARRPLSKRAMVAWFLFGLIASLAIGTVLAGNAHAATVPTSDCQTFSKYAGTVPCGSGDDLVKPTVAVAIPCALGFLGGPEAGIFACFGAVAGQALG